MNKSLVISIHIIAIITLLFAFRAASSILLPMSIALFAYIVMFPLVDRLYKMHLHKFIVVSILMLIYLLLISIILIAIIYTVDKMINTLPQYAMEYQKLYEKFSKYLAMHLNGDIKLDWLKNINDKISSLLNNITFSIISTLKIIIMAMIYDFFFFLEHKNIVKGVNKVTHSWKLRCLVGISIKQTSKYMRVKLIISSITAILTFVVLKSCSMQNAHTWGILVFFFNFIPVIGSLIITLCISFFAFLQFALASAWGLFSTVCILCILIQFIVGNIVDPKITGSKLNLNPIFVLFSLALWGYVFGIMGMFFAVPTSCFAWNYYRYFKNL